ncbi:MAG: AAA family ATPase [Anaerolineae bacterium]
MSSQSMPSASKSKGQARLRVAVGLGDPEREERLLPMLRRIKEISAVERCLAADELLEYARSGQVDVLLAAFDLHRLTDTILAEIGRTRVPLVFLGPHPDEDPTLVLPGPVLPLSVDPAALRDALLAATQGEKSGGASAEQPAAEMPRANRAPANALSVIAVASGHGSPGRTTVAVNLAAALGAVEPTVVVDADTSGPSLAAHLDADPTRNMYMLAHAEPETSREWDYALQQETQPLASRSPQARVLCGIPKAEMRARVSSGFFERLLAELRQRYRYIILDIGADLASPDVLLHRAALTAAQQVLLVVSADMVGLWHGRAALAAIKDGLGVPQERVAVVINRHDRRHHYTQAEIEWVLKTPTAAVIPYDYHAAQRALADQQPLVLDRGGRARRVLLDLAGRIHGGQIILPPEVKKRRVLHMPSWRGRRDKATAIGQPMGMSEGGLDGDDTIAVSANGHLGR